jgi:hypothetical protein
MTKICEFPDLKGFFNFLPVRQFGMRYIENANLLAGSLQGSRNLEFSNGKTRSLLDEGDQLKASTIIRQQIHQE